MRQVENLHVRELSPLMPPRELKQLYPNSETISRTVSDAREVIKRIMQRRDPRLLVVIGPCSIHDTRAAIEYAQRLQQAQAQFGDKLFLVMRTYLEKPRTTIGWRGLINDPRIDGSFDMENGLRVARELLMQINELGVPTATEMLDPISPQYFDDLIAFGAIGARTTESQTHRALASGVSMPVGFKNSTDGNIQSAVNSCVSAQHQHSFLGITDDGRSCVVKTRGNPETLVILRGSRGKPNYEAEHVAATEKMMRAAGLQPAVMIDCSHANSNSDYTRQPEIWSSVLRQHLNSDNALVGLMVESHLFEGKQEIPADRSQMRYGVSITDGCVSWETTVQMLAESYELIASSR